MRGAAGIVIVVLAGCGRLSFDPLGQPGLPTDDYSTAVLDDNPVAYWRLGDASGSVARDETGTYPGTYQGNCQLGATGIRAGGDPAVQFDGTCRVEIGSVLPFVGTAAFTIELWMNPDTIDGLVRWLVDREELGGARTGYQVAYQNMELWFERFTSDASATYVRTTAPPRTGVFQYAAVTFDGGIQRLYIDGVEIATFGTTYSAPPDTAVLVLGDNSRAVVGKFSGVLDEVAMYDHALPPARIAAHYTAR